MGWKEDKGITFVGIVEIHRVQADGSDRVWNDVH